MFVLTGSKPVKFGQSDFVLVTKGVQNGKFETLREYQITVIGDRDLCVFINSERETLLLKISSPETLSAENVQWYKSVKLTKVTENANES